MRSLASAVCRTPSASLSPTVISRILVCTRSCARTGILPCSNPESSRMQKENAASGQGRISALRIGSHEFNEWLNDNPLCRLSPFVCKRSLCHIAERRHGVDKRLHGADLYGQISSESSGTRQISGTGGQLDFVCGAQMAAARRLYA